VKISELSLAELNYLLSVLSPQNQYGQSLIEKVRLHLNLNQTSVDLDALSQMVMKPEELRRTDGTALLRSYSVNFSGVEVTEEVKAALVQMAVEISPNFWYFVEEVHLHRRADGTVFKEKGDPSSSVWSRDIFFSLGKMVLHYYDGPRCLSLVILP